ncbi:MAG: cobalamin B12-binding domain-containing protein [Candidatus Lokiarchaeota archaeon]|nr:cobalamin B12-binding domain-containing protein [Candidatus Lokiarchaeota archaeon]
MDEPYDAFLALLKAKDKEKCVRWAIDQVDSGRLTVLALYNKILAPALAIIACTGEDEASCIWTEHVSTNIVRTIVENMYFEVLKSRDEMCGGRASRGKRILILCPPEEYHDVGARMVADFFTIAGYEVIYIGSNTPKHALLAAVREAEPDYIGISVSNPYHVFGMKKLVDALKSAGRQGMKVIVGGAALESVPELYKTMGADMHLRTFEDICALKD